MNPLTLSCCRTSFSKGLMLFAVAAGSVACATEPSDTASEPSPTKPATGTSTASGEGRAPPVATYETNFQGLDIATVDAMVTTETIESDHVRRATIRLTDFPEACAEYQQGTRPKGSREVWVSFDEPASADPSAPLQLGTYPLREVLPMVNRIDNRTQKCSIERLESPEALWDSKGLSDATPITDEVVITESSATEVSGIFQLRYASPTGPHPVKYLRGRFTASLCDASWATSKPMCK